MTLEEQFRWIQTAESIAQVKERQKYLAKRLIREGLTVNECKAILTMDLLLSRPGNPMFQSMAAQSPGWVDESVKEMAQPAWQIYKSYQEVKCDT